MYESQLDTPADRFLSLCLQHAVSESWLSPEDFNQEFSAARIIEALESDDELRAQLLIEAAGVHEKIATKKSLTAAAEDLQLALDEGLCTPETILEIVTIDDHVDFLDQQELWAFFVRDHFWNQTSERARERMLFLLNTALELDLIDMPRLIRAIGVAEIARLLPKHTIEEVFTAAVQAGLDGRIFGADPFIALVPLKTWLQHLPLKLVWESAVQGQIAPAANLGSGPKSGSQPSPSTKLDAAAQLNVTAHNVSPPNPAPPNPAPTNPTQTAQIARPETKAAAPASLAEEAARAHAIEQLTELERLPRRADSLATPVLLALEAMYAEFFALETEEEQAECLREAFPNAKLLEEGLLAMAETLDPRLSEEQLRSRGADAAGLVQLVLFEERRLARQGQSSPPPAAPNPSLPPPLPVAVAPKIGSVPPPPGSVRKNSVPPPPLPNQNNRRN